MILEVLEYPHEALKVKSTPVKKVSKELFSFGEDLRETLLAKNALGLAATQVGRTEKVLAMKKNDKVLLMYNPSIVSKSNTRRGNIEHCLSFPDESYLVKRATWVKVKFLDQNNKQKFVTLENLDAVVFQHELSHLLGLTMNVEGTKINDEQEVKDA